MRCLILKMLNLLKLTFCYRWQVPNPRAQRFDRGTFRERHIRRDEQHRGGLQAWQPAARSERPASTARSSIAIPSWRGSAPQGGVICPLRENKVPPGRSDHLDTAFHDDNCRPRRARNRRPESMHWRAMPPMLEAARAPAARPPVPAQQRR
jgi:hypothetical protein